MNISDSGHPPERANGIKVTTKVSHHCRSVRGRDFRTKIAKAPNRGHTRIRHLEDPLRQRPQRHRTIRQDNDVPTTVIGVMAEGMVPTNTDVWIRSFQMRWSAGTRAD